MKKVLQKILLLFAVLTVLGHSILPHIHHDEIIVAMQEQDHDKEQTGHFPQYENDNTHDNQHHLFSFAQLDENFVPVKGQNNNFDASLTYLPALLVIYLSDDLPENSKTHFVGHKVFLPPEKYFPSSSHRGPPTV